MRLLEQNSRISPVDIDTLPEELRAILEKESDLEKITNFQRVMAHSPEALLGWRKISYGIRLAYAKTDPDFLRIEEMAIVRTSSINQASYCLTHNLEVSLEVGITPEQLVAVQGDYENSPLLTDAEKTAIGWAEAVTLMKAGNDDELFHRMTQHFTERQIVELTAVVGMWNFSNRFIDALNIELEPEGKRICFLSGWKEREHDHRS